MTQRKKKKDDSIQEKMQELSKNEEKDSPSESLEQDEKTDSNFIRIHGLTTDEELPIHQELLSDAEEELEKTMADIVSQVKDQLKQAEEETRQGETAVLNKDVKTPTDSELAVFKDKKKNRLFRAFQKKDKSSKQMNHEDNDSHKHPSPVSKESINQPSMLNLYSNLEMAEQKLKELEDDNNQVRLENQKLIVSGEALQESLDKLSNEYKLLKSASSADKINWIDQKKVMEQEVNSYVLEVKRLNNKIAVLEKHLERDVKSVRQKERELENKLVIKQDEISAIVRDKDKQLIKLRMELDQNKETIRCLQEENERVSEQILHNKEKAYRVIKALQLSLSLLTGESPSSEQKNSEDFNFPEPSSLSQDQEKEPLSRLEEGLVSHTKPIKKVS